MQKPKKLNYICMWNTQIINPEKKKKNNYLWIYFEINWFII